MFDRVGDDSGLTPAQAVDRRYREVNGDHPMSEVDDTYVRAGFVPATGEQLALMAAGLVPLPAYLLSDGTPMVHRDHLDPVAWVGGAERLHDWFVGYWSADQQADAERAWAAYLSGRHVGLKRVTPLTIRDRTRWTAQLDAALERLATTPGDHVGRGMLGEAVERLEDLVLPLTTYDALRFGDRPGTWQRLEQVRRDHLTPPLPDLPIRTRRLVLRRATPADADDLHAYYGRDDVTEHLLHETFSRPEVDDMLRRRLAEPRNHHACNLVVELTGGWWATWCSSSRARATTWPRSVGPQPRGGRAGDRHRGRDGDARPGVRTLRGAPHVRRPRHPQRALRRAGPAPRDATRAGRPGRLLVQGRVDRLAALGDPRRRVGGAAYGLRGPDRVARRRGATRVDPCLQPTAPTARSALSGPSCSTAPVPSSSD